MDTFGPPRPLRADPGFEERKARALAGLDPAQLDPPMVELVAGFNRLPLCFTLQCCHGHIIIPGSGPPGSWQRLPAEEPPPRALYQIAYLALVLRADHAGAALLADLDDLARADPAWVQLGSPAWFWDEQGQVNSYAVQVSPQSDQDRDRFEMDQASALRWLEAREEFLQGLRRLVA